MPDTLCRITVHCAGLTADLALPDTVAVGQLLPAIIGMVRDDHDVGAPGGRWALHRADGEALDESLTLHQNQVDNGELLWLTTRNPPPPRLTERDTCRVVAAAADTGDVPAAVFVTVGLTAAGMGVGALMWSAESASVAPWPIGTAASCAAVVGAVLANRAAIPLPATTCSLIALIFAAASGVLAVPEGPLTADLLLSSAATCAVATVLLRLTRCCPTPLTAAATSTALTAVVAMGGVLADVPLPAMGAVLATLSVAVAGIAPRLAIAVARIEPSTDSAPPEEPGAKLAHATVTGLVSGSSIAAAVGAAVVAYGQATGTLPSHAAIAFTAVLAAVLLLRARIHVDPHRRCVLILAGSACGAASFVIALIAFPAAAPWLGVLAAAAAAGALLPLVGITVGPAAHRLTEIAEYAALAAVVPLACWVAGVYRFARDAALL